MHLVPLLSLLLAAGPVRLAAPGFSYSGVDEKSGDAFVEFLADQLRAQGLDVTTKGQISTLLGFERQRQLLGCSEGSQSCLAELAGALGVDGLVTGSLTRTSRGSYVVTLTVVAASDGRTLASASQRTGDEDGLYDFFTRFAQEQAKKITSGLTGSKRTPAQTSTSSTGTGSTSSTGTGSTAQTGTSSTGTGASTSAPPTTGTTGTARSLPMPPPPSTRTAPPAAASASVAPAQGGSGPHPGWYVTGAGAVSLIVGGVMFGLAAARHGEIVAGEADLVDRTALVEALGQVGNQQTLAAILAGAGVAVAAGGTAWALTARPMVALTPSSVSVSFAWVLP